MILDGVQGIELPSVAGDFKKYGKKVQQYEKDIVAYAKKNGTCPEAGEIIYFGVCDGNACYVVLSLKPIKLIHLATYDGYQLPYANRLTASDIRKQVRRQKALDAIFNA